MNIKDSFAVLTYFKILLSTRARGYSGRIKECTLPRIPGSSTLRLAGASVRLSPGNCCYATGWDGNPTLPPSFIPILPLFPKGCKSVGWILRPVHKVNVLPWYHSSPHPAHRSLVESWGAGAEGQTQRRLTLKAGLDSHKRDWVVQDRYKCAAGPSRKYRIGMRIKKIIKRQ